MVGLRLIAASTRTLGGIFALWILNLSLAVTGLIVVDIYRASLKDMIDRQGRQMMGGDLALGARRPLTASERQTFRETVAGAAFTDVTEMAAMVSTKLDARLVSLRFVDDLYPLVGDLVVDQTPRHGVDLNDGARAWVAAELLPLLDLEVGGHLRLGDLDVTVAGVISRESSSAFRFGALAPRVIVHRKWIKATGLVRFGSTVTDTILARTASPDVRTTRTTLERALSDPALEITDPAGLERGPLKVLARLLDFLGLIGLVTLTLGWIGVYYLGRRWLTLEQPDVVRLKFLGLTSRRLFGLLLIKLAVVMSFGVVCGGILSWICARALLPLFKDSLPPDLELHWAWGNVLTLIAVGPVAGVTLLFESTRGCARTPPVIGGEHLTAARPRPVSVVILILLVATMFVALTMAQARSWSVTGGFFGVLVAALTVSALIGWGVVAWVRRRHARIEHWAWHLALAQWHRRAFTTILLIGVTTLATLLAQLIPHLEKTLVGALDQPGDVTRPALFLFDIQDDQLGPLGALLATNHVEVSQSAPLIRARILKINDRPFERQRAEVGATREEETDASFRNRGVNLSYRARLAKGESILRGRAWDQMRTGDPADISVESKYAERVGLKLDDAVTVDVQGLEVNARVASLRVVDWNSFEPNFFIQFADGVLNDAPKTWITTVTSRPELNVPATQRLIAHEFANVSMLDVRETIKTISSLVEKLGQGLRVASRLTLGLGTFVILMVIYFQLMSSAEDWRQLRWLGLSPRQIWGVQTLTFGGLVALGLFLGTMFASVAALALARYAFAAAVTFDGANVGVSVLGTALAVVFGIRAFGRSARRPMR